MRTLSNERLAHLRNEKRSRLRSASMARLSSSALARPATSAVTEWSMTSVQGIRGLTAHGSPPRSTMASRIAAKSTKTGTPVKSWNRTRAGMNSISSPAEPFREASMMREAARTACSSVCARRTTFSRSTTRHAGSSSAPGMADTSTMRRDSDPAARERPERALATALAKLVRSMVIPPLVMVLDGLHEVLVTLVTRGKPDASVEKNVEYDKRDCPN